MKKDSVEYGQLKDVVLRVMAKQGDESARAELEHRGASTSAPAAAPRRRRRLLGWQRPLTSPRYQWWPPMCGQPSYEMHQAAKAWQREEDERWRAKRIAEGTLRIDKPLSE